MNKKDIADIKKEFKLDTDMVRIKEIYNLYAQKETGDILHAESQHFEMLEQAQQELFLTNFKKVLTGGLDSKLFELKFEKDIENSTQTLLFNGLSADVDVWKANMEEIVAKFFEDNKYDKDVVFTFIRAEYRKPTKKKKEEYEDGADDEVYAHSFILGSLNKIDQPKKTVLFDYEGKEFKSNVVTDVIINLTTPLGGFLFPAFNNHCSDVNHILYSAGKKDQPEQHFIENVLNCSLTVTAKEEKSKFEQILKDTIGDKVDTTTISNIYHEIHKVLEENEDSEAPTLDIKDIKRILEVSGVEDVENLAHTFVDIVEDEKYEFKANSLIPNFTSKSIKIKTKVADVSIRPSELNGLKQVINHNGKRCILIEIDEDVNLEGFTLETERL